MAKVSDCMYNKKTRMIVRCAAYVKVIMQGIIIMINACAATKIHNIDRTTIMHTVPDRQQKSSKHGDKVIKQGASPVAMETNAHAPLVRKAHVAAVRQQLRHKSTPSIKSTPWNTGTPSLLELGL